MESLEKSGAIRAFIVRFSSTTANADGQQTEKLFVCHQQTAQWMDCRAAVGMEIPMDMETVLNFHGFCGNSVGIFG